MSEQVPRGAAPSSLQEEECAARSLPAGHPGLSPYPDTTSSVCPECLKRIPARRVRGGSDVFLVKSCPEHGEFETVIWRGEPGYFTWKRDKSPSPPLTGSHAATHGCPYDCGPCVNHRQRTCTALIEITRHCDLGCPVCFARSEVGKTTCQEEDEPCLEAVARRYDTASRLGGQCNIQLSGGEPTMREDLPRIVEMGREQGFGFIQLNSNGLRLAADPALARRLAGAGLASVFLQFDGVNEEAHVALRGRALLDMKARAASNCAAAGLGVVLVPTLRPGVNMDQIGGIIRFALEAGPGVRGVHFQPISYFGRYPHPPTDADRVTLPEVMRELERQTGGMLRSADFHPPGCEHSLCSFSASYLRTPDGGLRLKSDAPQNCCTPKSAHEGAGDAIGFTARQWAGAKALSGDCLTRPVLDNGKPCYTKPPSLDEFLRVAPSLSFTVSAMAFQDCWTLDLDRLRGCCIHVVGPHGGLIPFCAYNLTSRQGRTLYRDRLDVAWPPD